jgi:hypothetical protein
VKIQIFSFNLLLNVAITAHFIFPLTGNDPHVSGENVGLYLELLQEKAAGIREIALRSDPDPDENSSTTHSIVPRPQKQRASFPM